MKKTIHSLAAAFAFICVSAGVQAATIATYDVSVTVSGDIEDVPVVGNATISGGGSGGVGILDSNGIFSLNNLSPLLINISAGSGFLASSAQLNWGANGTIVGNYSSINATTSSLTGNTGTLFITENSPCSGSGILGSSICSEVAGLIDISQAYVLTGADGLPDPLDFDLVNDTSFVLGELGGAATLTINLSNPVLSPVPLPAAAWLFGSALLGLGAVKRRKA